MTGIVADRLIGGAGAGAVVVIAMVEEEALFEAPATAFDVDGTAERWSEARMDGRRNRVAGAGAVTVAVEDPELEDEFEELLVSF